MTLADARRTFGDATLYLRMDHPLVSPRQLLCLHLCLLSGGSQCCISSCLLLAAWQSAAPSPHTLKCVILICPYLMLVVSQPITLSTYYYVHTTPSLLPSKQKVPNTINISIRPLIPIIIILLVVVITGESSSGHCQFGWNLRSEAVHSGHLQLRYAQEYFACFHPSR